MELHIYLQEQYGFNVDVSVCETVRDIADNREIIHTYQTHFFSTGMLELGYDLILHRSDKCAITVALVDGKIFCNATNKELRVEHNLEKMLWAGKFCDMSLFEY